MAIRTITTAVAAIPAIALSLSLLFVFVSVGAEAALQMCIRDRVRLKSMLDLALGAITASKRKIRQLLLFIVSFPIL